MIGWTRAILLLELNQISGVPLCGESHIRLSEVVRTLKIPNSISAFDPPQNWDHGGPTSELGHKHADKNLELKCGALSTLSRPCNKAFQTVSDIAAQFRRCDTKADMEFA